MEEDLWGDELMAERDDALSALRVLNGETVLAGYGGGDRDQTLASVRDMASRLNGYAKALAEIATASRCQSMDEDWARDRAKRALGEYDRNVGGLAILSRAAGTNAALQSIDGFDYWPVGEGPFTAADHGPTPQQQSYAERAQPAALAAALQNIVEFYCEHEWVPSEFLADAREALALAPKSPA